MKTSIFDKRLLIITGKGGVGKTTVSCSLAVAAARKGKRVLVVEVGAKDHIGPLFEAKQITGYRGSKVWNSPDKKVKGSVHAARLEPEDALHEFVLRQIKSEMIYRLIFKNRVIRYFTAVAPGLEELMILGKIVDLAQEVGRDGKSKWDLVILDGPATGHGVSFLRIPQVALKMVQVGPLRKHFLQLWEFLRDARSTAINIVSLPEEMPVNESIELSEEIGDKLDVPTGLIFANAVFPELFDEREEVFYDRLCDSVVDELDPEKKTLWDKITEAASRRRTRAALHARYVSRLKNEIEWPLVQLPYLSGGQIGTKDLCQLAEHLSTS